VPIVTKLFSSPSALLASLQTNTDPQRCSHLRSVLYHQRRKRNGGLASGSLRVLCIGSAARSECAAECIRKLAAHVFQFSFRTRRRLLFSMQTRKGHHFQPMAARSFGWQFASVPGSTVPLLLRTTSPNRENGALKNELRRLSNAAF